MRWVKISIREREKEKELVRLKNEAKKGIFFVVNTKRTKK